MRASADSTSPVGPVKTDRTPSSSREGPDRTFHVVAIVLVVLAVTAAATGLDQWYTQTQGRGCDLGASIASYSVWTPHALANIPNGGGAGAFENTVDWTFSSGSLTVGMLRDSPDPSGYGGAFSYGATGIYADFDTYNWTVYSVTNGSGPLGSSSPCTQPYVAEVSPGWGCGESVPLALGNNSSDAVEPNYWNITPGEFCGSLVTPGTSVWFDTAFQSGGLDGSSTTVLNLCNWSTPFYDPVRGAVSLPIAFEAPYDGHSIRVVGTLEWVSFATGLPTASYTIPPGFIWKVAPVGTSSFGDTGFSPPGLLAFERLSC
jgi:hypothetical protein